MPDLDVEARLISNYEESMARASEPDILRNLILASQRAVDSYLLDEDGHKEAMLDIEEILHFVHYGHSKS